MLTPRFTLSQDNNYVTACIEAPYVKFSDGEMWMQDNQFSFYCKPYHLKLYFSANIIEDGTESAKYDVDLGTFTIKIPKLIKGEVFSDLDMLTKLMTNKQDQKKTKAAALIEVLQSNCNEEVEQTTEDEIDWSVDQVIPEENAVLAGCCYGFNMSVSGLFNRRTEERHELLDISDPDNTPIAARRELQKDHETQHFNPDHYLGDLFGDDDVMRDLVTYKTAINTAYINNIVGKTSITVAQVSAGEPESEGGQEEHLYTKEELEAILRLPKKEYLLELNQKRAALVGMVDILCACLYDIRTTQEEATVESAWTIRKLSSTLSWVVTNSDLRSAIISSLRRSLCFPLYRHWILAMEVLNDLKVVLSMGKQQVLKCFLYVHKQFSNTECYHILNDLYITDYCVWVQSLSDNCLKSIATEIEQMSLSKQDLDLDLTYLENDHLLEMKGSDNPYSDSEISSVDPNDSSIDSDGSSIDSSIDSDDSSCNLASSNRKSEVPSSIAKESASCLVDLKNDQGDYTNSLQLTANSNSKNLTAEDHINHQLSQITLTEDTVLDGTSLIQVISSSD